MHEFLAMASKVSGILGIGGSTGAAVQTTARQAKTASFHIFSFNRESQRRQSITVVDLSSASTED